MINRFTYFTILVFSLFTSCKEGEDLSLKQTTDRTTLVYMVAENDLYYNALDDIQEMKTNDFNEFDRLLVYIDPPAHVENTKPQLLQIAKNEAVVLKQYEEANSASGEILSMVIGDMLTL